MAEVKFSDVYETWVNIRAEEIVKVFSNIMTIDEKNQKKSGTRSFLTS